MKEINDIILMHHAEGILDKDLSEKVNRAISTDNNLKAKFQMYKNTINLLKKFGKSLELRRKNPKKKRNTLKYYKNCRLFKKYQKNRINP